MVAGVVFVIAGIVVMSVALVGRAEKLPRNYWVGIRLPSTLKSDEAWRAAHRASWLYVFVTGILMIGLGIDIARDPFSPPPSWVLLAAVVPLLLAGAIRAHRAARSAG